MGFWGYVAATASFGVLALLLAISAHGRPHGRWLILAAFVSALWALEMALDAYSGLPAIAGFWAELCRASAWLIVLQKVGWHAIGARLSRFIGLSIAALALLGVLMSAGVRYRFLQPGTLLSPLGMLLALMVLILLEQIYRNAAMQARWSLRYLVLGIGSVYAFDLFMYAEANMLRTLAADTWQARGFVNALLLPLVLISARRNPEWQLDVFVSRQVTFYTGAIIGVGAYALLMALGGYLALKLGGRWGIALQTTFLAVAAVLLLALVFSSSIRRSARVFFSKHFYRNKYDYRVEWLRFVKTLSVAAPEGFGPTVVRAVAQIFSSPGGALYVSSSNDRHLIPHAAWPMSLESLHGAQRVELGDAFSQYLLKSRWVIDLLEYREYPDHYDNVVLPTWLTDSSHFRLVAPLILNDQLVGMLALQEPPRPFTLSYEDRDLLKTVCQHIATHVAQYFADQRLAESRQFEAHGKLAAFMMHDLKNSVAQLQLLIENSALHKHNPAFLEDAISTTGNVVERINRLIQQLGGKSETGRRSSVALGPLLRDVVSRLGGRQPAPQLDRCESDCSVNGDPSRLAAIIEHAIRNAQDATPQTGSVTVRLSCHGGIARIAIADTGPGMSAQFVRERLFRPFDSTKGAKGMGIGAYQIREYAKELGGDVEVITEPGKGTTLCIILPQSAAVPEEI